MQTLISILESVEDFNFNDLHIILDQMTNDFIIEHYIITPDIYEEMGIKKICISFNSKIYTIKFENLLNEFGLALVNSLVSSFILSSKKLIVVNM